METSHALFVRRDLAYITLAVVDGASVFVLHGADGRPLAVVGDRETASALAQENDLALCSVH